MREGWVQEKGSWTKEGVKKKEPKMLWNDLREEFKESERGKFGFKEMKNKKKLLWAENKTCRIRNSKNLLNSNTTCLSVLNNSIRPI